MKKEEFIKEIEKQVINGILSQRNKPKQLGRLGSFIKTSKRAIGRFFENPEVKTGYDVTEEGVYWVKIAKYRDGTMVVCKEGFIPREKVLSKKITIGCDPAKGKDKTVETTFNPDGTILKQKEI